MNKNAFALNFIFMALGASTFLTSCSTKSSLSIVTQPEGAEVFGDSGQLLGKTPLSLDVEKKSQLRGGHGLVNLEVTKYGYQTLKLSLDEHNYDDFNFILKPVNKETFKATALRDYGKDINSLASRLLAAQGAIVSGKLLDAETQIQNLQKEFPSLAVIYALEADLRVRQNNKPLAIEALQQAHKLAPDDEMVLAGMRRLKIAP